MQFQVVQQLLAYSRDFRVLALSATPGSDLKSVQQVTLCEVITPKFVTLVKYIN